MCVYVYEAIVCVYVYEAIVCVYVYEATVCVYVYEVTVCVYVYEATVCVYVYEATVCMYTKTRHGTRSSPRSATTLLPLSSTSTWIHSERNLQSHPDVLNDGGNSVASSWTKLLPALQRPH